MKKLVVLAFVLAFGMLFVVSAGSAWADDKGKIRPIKKSFQEPQVNEGLTVEQQAFVNWCTRETPVYAVQLVKPGVIHIRVKPESARQTRQIMEDVAENYRKHINYGSNIDILVFAGNQIVMKGEF